MYSAVVGVARSQTQLLWYVVFELIADRASLVFCVLCSCHEKKSERDRC
jgi:hypothetical protein